MMKSDQFYSVATMLADVSIKSIKAEQFCTLLSHHSGLSYNRDDNISLGLLLPHIRLDSHRDDDTV